MALRNIVFKEDPILHKVCRPVEKVNDRTKELVDDMIETMKEANGAGLAAPQVGIMRRIFVAQPEQDEIYCFINPEILSVEGEQESEEGCLSVPGYFGKVTRPEKVSIKGLDRDGNMQEFNFDGFAATVICHEFDHLEGILYTDKAHEVFELSADDEQ